MMVLITGNRKTIHQWNDNIVDTQKDLNFTNTIGILMDELNINGSTHDSISHSDIAPQFQSETR